MDNSTQRPTKRLRYLYRIVSGSTPKSENPSYWDGDVPWVTPEDLGKLIGWEIKGTRRQITEAGYRSCGTTLVPKGSIVLSTRAPIGQVAIAGKEMCSNQGCKSLVLRHGGHTKFHLYELVARRSEIESLGRGSTFKELATDDLADVRLDARSEAEHEMVADYLDRETARVDGMIAKKEELLRLLEEKRTSLISHAVGRGLDPTARLKDSRIPWLGKIPVHWEVWRLGHLAVVGNGSTPNRDNLDYWSGGKHPWLNSSVVNDDLVTQAPDFVTDVALRECHLPSVARGSVLVALTGEGKTRGKAAVLNFAATINQHIAYITPRPSLMESHYLQRLLTRGYDALRVLSDGAGSTKGAVTCEQLRNLRIVVPPLTEQHSIISYLNGKLSTIDRLKGTLKESMQFLREHRTALISAAVTGKIDVRNA